MKLETKVSSYGLARSKLCCSAGPHLLPPA